MLMKKFGKIKTMTKELIKYDEFLAIEDKLEIRYGQILSAERIEKSNKLLRLTVSFGKDESDIKTVVTNLGGEFEPESFLGLILPFVVNLTPSKMMGVVSEAMIMVPSNNGKIELQNYTLGSKLL
jgi:methionyl-tRNA synthetase